MNNNSNNNPNSFNIPKPIPKPKSKPKNVVKSVTKTTANIGYKTTKATVKFSSKLVWESSKFIVKKTGNKVNDFVKKSILRFVALNATVVIPVLIIALILLLGVGSLTSTLLVVYAKDKIESAQESVKESATDLVDTYSQYLAEINQQKTIDYGDGEENTNTSGNSSLTGSQGNIFNGTIGTATTLEGKALLTQLYNAMASTQNNYSIEGFDMEFIYGVAVTETCCSPIKWSYYVPVGNDYNASGNYDVKTYGVKDFMTSRKAGQIDESTFNRIYNDGDTYITAWQMDYSLFKGSGGKPYGWNADTWINNYGNAKYDPFNMTKAMDALGNYIKVSRQPTITKVQLKSDSDRADMMRMIYAIRHVGTTNKTKSRADGCTFSKYETNTEWRKTWCYPYIEGLNPHIDLMRSALNEYKSNGPLFQEYYNFMHAQSQTNSNGAKSLTIIEKLYQREGWERVSNGWRKKFGDGDGYVTVKGQDIGYPIRVFWGAKIGFPEFKKLAQNS